MTDELKQWEYDKGYAKGQIDILEKIKAEIRTIPQVHIKTGVVSLDKELVVPLNKVIEKLDKHIVELKGEKDD